ncbi:MAG: hypothetical protein EXS35_11770 [Pedosphaera sp.]|nr:hypothetical protein [Pedosphaera sp.]
MKDIVRTYLSGTRHILIAGFSVALLANNFSTTTRAQGQVMTEENFLRMPAIGDYQLRVLSSNVVELMMVTRKDPDPTALAASNSLDATDELRVRKETN